MDILSLVRKNIQELKPYSTARDEFKGKAEVFLDANENPFPTGYNRYPDPHQVKLKERIADLKQVSSDRIFLGNGSDEGIDLLIRAFCEPGKENILIPEPTYGMYAVCASINDIGVNKTTLTPDFDLDPDAVAKSVNKSVKIIFLCSPGNPSGRLLSKSNVIQLISSVNCLVVLDEAYIDFTPDSGFLPLLDEFPNLVILQTLSKAWGLAGLRLGMVFASPRIISILNKIKPPYNIGSATQQLVLDRLQTPDEIKKQVEQLINFREKLVVQLNRVPCVETVYPSDANFILVKITDAQACYRYLMKSGIIVRDRSTVILCEDCLRITVGTEQENNALILALENYTAK